MVKGLELRKLKIAISKRYLMDVRKLDSGEIKISIH